MQKKTKPASNPTARIVYVTIVVFAVILFGWTQRETIRGWFGADEPSIDEPLASTEPRPEPVRELATTDATPVGSEAEQRWTGLVGEPPTWPLDLTDPPECEAIRSSFERVCGVIGTRDYLKPGTDVCALLREVSPRLAANSPVVSGELRDFASILANAFHLFRSVGRERLATLRSIADEESALVEPLALVGWRWLISREACDPGSGVTNDTLYDYSAFLVQTLGGQAYLRRRPPNVEALVTFYALVALESAVERGHNPHGIDPRPEIRRARELIRDRPLVFGDRYLEWLDATDRRWESRARTTAGD
ncbi:MAG: hypothetical protein GY716_21680 [bacterium]|nr:hypothetical protein [bacterium]